MTAGSIDVRFRGNSGHGLSNKQIAPMGRGLVVIALGLLNRNVQNVANNVATVGLLGLTFIYLVGKSHNYI
jgi:hypothetical protein